MKTEYGKRFRFLEGLPSGYNGKVLPGSHAISYIENFWTMVIQEISLDVYSINYQYYQYFQFLQPFTLRWRPAEARPFSCFAIRNDLHETIEGYGALKISQVQWRKTD